MKRRSIVLLIILAIVCCCAGKSESSLTKLDCPDDFILLDAISAPDGTLLLSGFTGPTTYENRKTVATMINCALNGEKLLEMYRPIDDGATDRYFYSYNNASFLGGSRIAARLTEPEGNTIEYIEQGRVVGQAEGLPKSMDGYLLLADGALIRDNPDSNSARIIRLNEQGETLWQLVWPERLRILGLATNGEMHIAYGYIDIRRPDDLEVPGQSAVIAFDDQGMILWRHDIPSIELFADCAWTNGKIVLVGGTPWSDDKNEKGVVTAFDEQGRQLFTHEYTYPESGFHKVRSGRVVSTDFGYVACVPLWIRAEALSFMAVDRDGGIIAEWNEKMEGIQSVGRSFILNIDGNLYIISNDEVEHEPLPEDEDGNIIGIGTIPYMTVVKRIELEF